MQLQFSFQTEVWQSLIGKWRLLSWEQTWQETVLETVCSSLKVCPVMKPGNEARLSLYRRAPGEKFRGVALSFDFLEENAHDWSWEKQGSLVLVGRGETSWEFSERHFSILKSSDGERRAADKIATVLPDKIQDSWKRFSYMRNIVSGVEQGVIVPDVNSRGEVKWLQGTRALSMRDFAAPKRSFHVSGLSCAPQEICPVSEPKIRRASKVAPGQSLLF